MYYRSRIREKDMATDSSYTHKIGDIKISTQPDISLLERKQQQINVA